jgi:NAD(P)-dependent dehydrogenase (short-subunit alcohol dehydrogenase family)
MWAASPLALDIARHTMRILRKAGTSWDPIPASEQFRAEFWPLEKRKEEGARGELAGRVAWISGAASGIGRAVAARFAREGAHLLLVDIDADGVREVAEGIGGAALWMRCDVTSEEEVGASFRRVALAFGGVDVVVSNAGAAAGAMIEELSREAWERSFALNATSHFLVARAAMSVLRMQGIGGSIVFTASKNVLAPGKGFAAYSAAKAAEAQLAKVLALEAAEIGVRVNTLHPDAVFQGTRLWSDEVRRERARAHGVEVAELEDYYAGRNLLGKRVRPEDVAEAALFFASDRSSRTTGAFLNVDGGLKEAFPR